MPRERKKLFVLDTNVLLHDPNSLLRFANNDVAIPFITLEELDKHKTGQQDLNRNARAAIRLLEAATQQPGTFEKGFSLKAMNHGGATGTLAFLPDPPASELAGVVLDAKADNRILNVMLALRERKERRPVVLVSKDLNLRVKARALSFTAEDYLHDHAVEDADLLYRGYRTFTAEELEDLLQENGCWSDRGHAYYTLAQPTEKLRINEFVTLPDGTMFRVFEASENSFSMRQERDFRTHKNAVWGICARNAEQSYALSLLLDPDVDFVSLLGPAGTGKTLVTLAAALSQTMDQKLYQEVIFTRATVPLGDDIGFLPGTEEEKMAAWMGALDDNLEVLAENQGREGHGASKEQLRELVKVKAITFMRGRTFHKKFLIIDEAQNLTPKQMKALVTRSGPGTKVVCMGNLAQIDTPYLSETSSGLTFAVEGFKGWAHYGHLILETGERSRLATYANDNL